MGTRPHWKLVQTGPSSHKKPSSTTRHCSNSTSQNGYKVWNQLPTHCTIKTQKTETWSEMPCTISKKNNTHKQHWLPSPFLSASIQWKLQYSSAINSRLAFRDPNANIWLRFSYLFWYGQTQHNYSGDNSEPVDSEQTKGAQAGKQAFSRWIRRKDTRPLRASVV